MDDVNIFWNQIIIYKLYFRIWKTKIDREFEIQIDNPIVTWSPTERREIRDYYYSSVFELTGQGQTVERGI